MNAPVTTAQKQQAAPKSLFAAIVTLPLTIFGILCGALLLSIVVECVLMQVFWKNHYPEGEGWKHAQEMFYYEQNQFEQGYRRSLLMSEPVQKTQWLLNKAHEWVFIRSGIAEKRDAVLTSKITDSVRKRTFREYLGMAYGSVQTYVQAAAYTTLTFTLRVVILFLSLPLFILALFVGAVDGLVRRDIRHFTYGHESGFVYHRAKSLLIPLLVLPWALYLALPVSVSPILILLPAAISLGIAANISAASFKKYL
ncbi:TIGR03747 family integrating conjugative element membrane protein [Saezia sanguinis]|uniref:TIGR03747 family integrating conjugative element membrane protein n=1 Tax=Saezia sanguinis TaxID=1965230 RepID=UPI003025DC0E